MGHTIKNLLILFATVGLGASGTLAGDTSNQKFAVATYGSVLRLAYKLTDTRNGKVVEDTEKNPKAVTKFYVAKEKGTLVGAEFVGKTPGARITVRVPAAQLYTTPTTKGFARSFGILPTDDMRMDATIVEILK